MNFIQYKINYHNKNCDILTIGRIVTRSRKMEPIGRKYGK